MVVTEAKVTNVRGEAQAKARHGIQRGIPSASPPIPEHGGGRDP